MFGRQTWIMVAVVTCTFFESLYEWQRPLFVSKRHPRSATANGPVKILLGKNASASLHVGTRNGSQYEQRVLWVPLSLNRVHHRNCSQVLHASRQDGYARAWSHLACRSLRGVFGSRQSS